MRGREVEREGEGEGGPRSGHVLVSIFLYVMYILISHTE